MKELLTQVTPTRGFAFILSLGLLLWGLWVGNPWVHTFGNDFYAGLEAIAHETVWGVAFLVAGSTMMYGVLSKKVDVISIGAMFGFLLWATVAGLYGFADPSVTPTATNTVLALAHAWLWLSVKQHPRLFTERMAVLYVSEDDLADYIVWMQARRARSRTIEQHPPST